jgi:hypothetical protein
VSGKLRVASLYQREILRGDLSVTNRCEGAVAILTAPIEQHLRLTSDIRFTVEDGIDRVYGIAYIFRTEVGLGQDAFRGDGGLEVSYLPDYVVVEPGSTATIPITSGKPLDLPAGRYGLALFTIATPSAIASSQSGEIDFRNSVASLRGSRAAISGLILPTAAIRLAPVGFFEVRPRR